MAKIKRGIFKVCGKVDGKIMVQGKKGDHIREPVNPGTKKDEPALKKNYKRTGPLNRLASEVNNVVKDHSGALKASMIYQDILSRLRNDHLTKDVYC